VKLLEAFSMACPVVTTSIGAMGFPLRNGIEALVADNVEDFTAALRRLIVSEDLRRRMGESARGMILRDFSWITLRDQFLQVVKPAGKP
jgi:glycosyltransferase involved in cell wall biosynthesis